jgi:hypothetical protein
MRAEHPDLREESLSPHTQAGAPSEASWAASCQVPVAQPGHASAMVTARLSGPVLLA